MDDNQLVSLATGMKQCRYNSLSFTDTVTFCVE